MGFEAFVAPAIEAGGSIAASAVSGLFAANQAKKNRAFQERMYNKQVEDNRKNWEMVNEYNLPSAQLQRLLDAGLSPALMYSDGASALVANSAQGGSLPSGAQGQAVFQNPFANFTNSLVAMKQLDAHIENVRADSALKEAEALAATAGAKKTDTETEFNIKSMRDRILKIQRDNEVQRSVAVLNEELAKTEPKKREEIDSNIQHLNKQIDVFQATIDDINNQIKNRDIITNAQRKQIEQDIQNSIKTTAATVYKLSMEGRKAFAEAFLLEIEGAIHDMPEWQATTLWKHFADLRKTIEEGNELEISNALEGIVLRFSQRDSSSEGYQKFLNSWVNPLMDSFGKILGPAAGGYAGARLGRKK